MMFNVHTDATDELSGYMVPNSFSGKASIYVTSGGKAVYQGPCEHVLEEVVKAGRHDTGQVGFHLNEENVPGLSSMDDLSVFDGDTGILIYRRNHEDLNLQRRVFRLETCLGIPSSYRDAMMPNFAYSVSDIHLYGFETVGQLFNLTTYPSMYFEGRVHIKPHQRYLNENLFSFVSVTDPFVALATVLTAISDEERAILGEMDDREYTVFMPVVALLDGIDRNFSDKIARRLRSAPKDVLTALESPLVGLLTGTTPGVGGARGDVPFALDVLSQFDMTILERQSEQSHDELAYTLGIPKVGLRPLQLSPAVEELAETLRELSFLHIVLENDLIVYHCLEQSVELATASAAENSR